MGLSSIINALISIHLRVSDSVYLFYLNNSRAILDFLHNSFHLIFLVLIWLAVIIGGFYLVMSFIVAFKKKPAEKEFVSGHAPFVTIQIPTYNELAAINCAKRCLDFDYPKDRFEIIIGDDSNNPDISAQIDSFAAQHPGVIKVTRRGSNAGFKPGNLNHMLKASQGDYIVIFDSDFLPESDFLKRIISPFMNDASISAVQARWNIYNFNQNLYSTLAGTIMAICHHIVLPFIMLGNGNVTLCGSAEAVRKKDLIALGGWQQGSLTEDIEYSLRLIKIGKRIVYLEDLECKGEAPHTLRDLVRQQMRWAYGVMTALIEHWSTIASAQKVRARNKLNVLIFASGYLFTILLLAIALFGVLSFISDRPAPIIWSKVFIETAWYVALTSGFLFTSMFALGFAKKFAKVPQMVLGALSIGFVVTYFVNLGIAKAIFGRKMQWYMLSKNGNRVALHDSGISLKSV